MWLGAWAWDAVAEPLRRAGHEVHAVTLAGVAERAPEAASGEVDLDRHVADIVGLIEREDLRDVVLVGHSYGGVPARVVADRTPERVARVVYVDSGPLPDGVSQADVGGRPEGATVPPPSWDPADDPTNNAGLDAATVALLHERATAHPAGSATQPVRLRKPEQPPTDLVLTTLPIDAVRAMIDGNDPFFTGLDRRDYRLHELPTGHYPMFSRPAELAELLAGLGAASG